MGDSKNWSNFAAKQPLTMEQKFGKNSILGRAKRPSRADIEALREFCEREGKMVEYRKGEQLVKRFSQDKKSMDLRCLVAEHLLSQARARYTDLHRATPLERYELPHSEQRS